MTIQAPDIAEPNSGTALARLGRSLAGAMRRPYAALALLALLLAVFMLVEIAHHKFAMHDFQVYHAAASRLLAGEDLHQPEADGFYHFKYSPSAALLFVPLALLPLPLAKAAYWLFLSGAICLWLGAFLEMASPGLMRRAPSKANGLLLLAALSVGVHIQRELHLGQVNQLILALYAAMFWLDGRGRPWLSALAWAASLFLKPYGLIFLPYFVLRRRFGLVVRLGLAVLVLGLLPGVFYLGPDGLAAGAGRLLAQYAGWLREMGLELAQKQDLLAAGNHTVFSFLARYTPLRLLDFTPAVSAAYQAVVLCLAAAGLLAALRRGTSLREPAPLEMALLAGLIPLLSGTSHNCFGFLGPAALLVLLHFRDLPAAWRAAGVTGMVLVGGNIHDLVGRAAWNAINDLSLITLGAMLLLGSLLELRNRRMA